MKGDIILEATLRVCDLLICGCSVVLPGFRLLEHAAIAVDRGIILEIGDVDQMRTRYQPNQTIWAEGKLAMPGMYDCHTHTVQQLLKGGTVDEPPIIWRRILVPYESHLTAEDRYHAARLDLNDRVTVRAFAQPHETGIHARFLHFIEQELAFGSIKPRMVDLRTRLRQRNRLVESLAAAAGRQRRTGRGFAGSYKMLHLIDIVNVARTKIQNLHGKSSLSFV